MKFISSTNDIRKYLGLKPKKDIKFKNISIDTRTIKKDSLFIALKGENFNGNKFIEKAFSSGAIAVLCSDKSYIKKNNVIYVPSVRKALSKISSEIESDFKGKKILITGSNGKTSTTNIISKSLPKCSSTIKNFNNEIGLPISIMSSKKDSKYMVLEAGAAKKGDIEYLSKIVKPDIGIITNIGNSHLEKLINIEGVFKVKSELIKNIRKGGTLIVPNDINYLQRWKNMAKGINVIPVPKKFIAKHEKISKDKKVMTFDIIKSCNDDKKSFSGPLPAGGGVIKYYSKFTYYLIKHLASNKKTILEHMNDFKQDINLSPANISLSNNKLSESFFLEKKDNSKKELIYSHN